MINRDQYKQIKKYSKKEMEDFLSNIYKEAFTDGAEVKVNRLKEILRAEFGIGEKRFSRIEKKLLQ